MSGAGTDFFKWAMCMITPVTQKLQLIEDFPASYGGMMENNMYLNKKIKINMALLNSLGQNYNEKNYK